MTKLAIVSKQVRAGDVSLQVTTLGEGPALVWLHGSGPGASGLSNFKQNLPAFQDFSNYVVDMPRFGGSDRPTIDESLIPYSAERVARALDTLGVEKASFVGNSYGGGVAAWFAGTWPKRVERLVLMAPGGIFPASMKPEDLPEGIKLLFDYMAKGPDLERMRKFTLAMLSDPTRLTEELVEERYKASDREPEVDVRRGPPKFGSVEPVLASITAPTLLIWGVDDRFVKIETALSWIRSLQNAELHVFTKSGHWVQFERRDDFDRLAGEFLRRA